MAHHGPGIVLKTVFDQKGKRVLRTIFDKKLLYYKTIEDYIPPLFLAVNYEDSALTRGCFLNSQATTSVHELHTNQDSLTTNDLFQNNVKFVESLLASANCGFDACQVTFLRLETAGDFQRTFERLYPMWNVGVGALIRLTFNTWPVRSRALKLLATNAANNQDVYTINYAANLSPVTVVDYLEPLFSHCVRITKANGHETDPYQYTASQSRAAKHTSAAKAAAVASTTEMFEINFCVIDEPAGIPKATCDDIYQRGYLNDNESTLSLDSSAPGTTVSKRSDRRKKAAASTVSVRTETTNNDAAGRIKKVQIASAVVEKQRSMCGSLSVHDVSPFFSILNARRLSKLTLDQLEDLPVLIVRCEKHFCVTTCCVVDRTDHQLAVMHVYYCWNQDVYTFLKSFSETHAHRENTQTTVTVSQLCTEDIEARLTMLRDLRNVIWKDNMNAYVRLALNDALDEDMVAREFYEPLVFRVQRNTADLETEIKRSVQSSQASGSKDMFVNSITLDCSRLCNDLDPKTCRFARTYRRVMDDCTLTLNGSVRLDKQTTQGNADARQHAFRLLEYRQNIYAGLVWDFRSERILELAFDMASELRLGLLDVFGLKYTCSTVAKNTFNPTGKDSSVEDRVFDSTRASNCVFLETLLDSSLYFGTCGSISVCDEFFAKEKNVKPVSHSVRGLYRHDMIEFDLQSAYPSITTLYNISPETTAIVDRTVLNKLDEDLETFVTNNSTCPQPVRHDKVMSTIFHQIGHVNEINSNLVVVSLRSEIYVGFLARMMERLIIKRKNRNRLLNQFYKKLANVIYGCTGKTGACNDLFSPQCESAIRSLCKSIMLSTLQNVPPETVLLSQTDGALFYAGPRDDAADRFMCDDSDSLLTCKDLETSINSTIDAVISSLGNLVTPIRLVPKLRQVDMCLLIDQNRYLMLYTDGKTVWKGQEWQSQHNNGSNTTNPGGAETIKSLLCTIAKYIRDGLVPQRSVAVELGNMLESCFRLLRRINAEHFVEWFVTTAVPSTNEVLYSDANQISLHGFKLKDFSSSTDTSHLLQQDTAMTRFGDSAAVWPTLVYSDGRVHQEFRVSRPIYNDAVRPNHVFVMKNILRYWVKWLFTIRYSDQDEAKLMRMFYAICKKYETEVLE